MESKVVTIVIPAFNVENYIDECLLSIQAQTHEDIEVIVVDDASTDKTAARVEAFAESDARFSLIRQDKSNAGVARNRGMKTATGDYLLFFDADDRMAPEMIAKMLARAEETSAEIVICRARSFDDETGETLVENDGFHIHDLSKIHSRHDLGDRLFTCVNGWPWDKLFLRSFVEANHLEFQDLSSTNDAYFVYVAMALAQQIACVDSSLVDHRKRRGSIEVTRSKTPHNAIKAYRAIESRLRDEGLWEEVGRACVNWGLMHQRWNFRTLEGESSLEAFSDYRQLLDEAFEQPPVKGADGEEEPFAMFSEDRDTHELLVAAEQTSLEHVLALRSTAYIQSVESLDRVRSREKRLNNEIVKLKENIRSLEKSAENAKADIERRQKAADALARRLQQSNDEIERIKDSESYRLGVALTAPVRAVKRRFTRN